MTGGHQDNYLLANAGQHPPLQRRPTAAAGFRPRHDQAGGGFEQGNVGPEFADHVNETLPPLRGADGLHYTNQTGRNDLVACKVARDAQISLLCPHEPANTPYTDPHWMWLLIDADGDPFTAGRAMTLS